MVRSDIHEAPTDRDDGMEIDCGDRPAVKNDTNQIRGAIADRTETSWAGLQGVSTRVTTVARSTTEAVPSTLALRICAENDSLMRQRQGLSWGAVALVRNTT